MKAAIELMDMMNTKGGSLGLCSAIFDWHARHAGTAEKVTHERLRKELLTRHNLEHSLPCERKVLLPASNVKVNLACHDVMAQTIDLLSDPRIGMEDFLFFDEDPRKGPPEEFLKVGDINTGRAHRESTLSQICDSLIKNIKTE